jgi:tetratricopeptide (TPR) repeat protein
MSGSTKEAPRGDFHARLASLPRDCIDCDACGKASPSVQCQKCETVYYCNESCRKAHANEHNPDCRDIKAISQQKEAEVPSMEELLQPAGEEAINLECGICLEEQMQQPVTLDCKHAFCATCLVAWQRQKGNLTSMLEGMNLDRSHSCPMCRAETDGKAEEDLLLRARLLAGRANYMKKNPGAKQDLLEKALAILDKVLEVDKPHLQAYVSKAEVLQSLGKYQEQVDIIDELVSINSSRLEKAAVLGKLEAQINEAMAEGNMEFAERLQEEYIAYAAKEGDLGTRFKDSQDLTEMLIQQAEAYIELGEWQTAKDILMTKIDVLSTYGAGSAIQVRRSVMGLARCAYELKVFEKAIAASEWAIEMNRHFPGVYKYKALAQKKMGDLDAAILTMNQAVLYETPWDEENRQKALSLYDELLAEKEEA